LYIFFFHNFKKYRGAFGKVKLAFDKNENKYYVNFYFFFILKKNNITLNQKGDKNFEKKCFEKKIYQSSYHLIHSFVKRNCNYEKISDFKFYSPINLLFLNNFIIESF